MFEGFRSRWMIPFWWACCTARQTRHEQFEPLADGEPLAVAVIGDRDATDELHDEVGAARFGRPSVVDLGDVGMLHHRQRLPLGLEAGDHLLRIHAGLDDLESDLPAHGLRLLGQVDDAHAPLADHLQELVRADDRADVFVAEQPCRIRSIDDTAGDSRNWSTLGSTASRSSRRRRRSVSAAAGLVEVRRARCGVVLL